MKVILYFPSFVANGPVRAEAIAEARETKTQYVVLGKDVEITDNPGRVTFGWRELRFDKETGSKIPYSKRGWRCAGPAST